MECFVADVIETFGSYITFHIQFDSYDDSPPKNAFDILMTSSKTRTLLTFSFSEELKSNDELKLEIASYVGSHSVGWTTEQTKKNHELMVPIVNEEDTEKLKIIIPVIFRNLELVKKYKELIDAVKTVTYWEKVNVDLFYSENNSVAKIDSNADESIAFEKNYEVCNKLKESMPKYATQAMRKEFVNTCEMFLENVEKSQVRYIYKEFMEDYSADESEIDVRVRLAFDLNNPELVTNLRHFNESQISIYNPFWDE
ncbi:7516_t:CDS:2, partial [Funneliformis geosporum]